MNPSELIPTQHFAFKEYGLPTTLVKTKQIQDQILRERASRIANSDGNTTRGLQMAFNPRSAPTHLHDSHGRLAVNNIPLHFFTVGTVAQDTNLHQTIQTGTIQQTVLLLHVLPELAADLINLFDTAATASGQTHGDIVVSNEALQFTSFKPVYDATQQFNFVTTNQLNKLHDELGTGSVVLVTFTLRRHHSNFSNNTISLDMGYVAALSIIAPTALHLGHVDDVTY
ncbi:hypothetical protein HDU76_005180 [Blyttiomyces sp. JEL0837]|nr:hypothetical protein HDU76_005180 [Blyttiomyces sp. JEL0837]